MMSDMEPPIAIVTMLASSISLISAVILFYYSRKEYGYITKFTYHQAIADFLYTLSSILFLALDKTQYVCVSLDFFRQFSKHLSMIWAAHMAVFMYNKLVINNRIYEVKYTKICFLSYLISAFMGILSIVDLLWAYSPSACGIYMKNYNLVGYIFHYLYMIVAMVCVIYCYVKVYSYLKEYSFGLNSKYFFYIPIILTFIWIFSAVNDALRLLGHSNVIVQFIYNLVVRSIGLINLLLYGRQVMNMSFQQKRKRSVELTPNEMSLDYSFSLDQILEEDKKSIHNQLSLPL